jgi:hypothetical protein
MVRERTSLAAVPGCILAPDLALGIRGTNMVLPPRASHGVFLRSDIEQLLLPRYPSLPDPALVCTTPHEYFALASLFEHIFTDRLHFAIAGLIAGRTVTLLPNSYHKNRSMFDTWLSGLGCEWRDDLNGIEDSTNQAIARCWQYLVGPPSRLLRWSLTPARPEGQYWEQTNEGILLRDHRGHELMSCDVLGGVILEQCDGTRNIEEITSTLMAAYPSDPIRVAADVQDTLRTFVDKGVLLGERHRNETPAVQRKCDSLSISIQPRRDIAGWTCIAARVSRPNHPDYELWFAVPSRYANVVTDRVDPFVVTLVMEAMSLGVPIRVDKGTVSRGLVENLDRFQKQWTDWRDGLSVVPLQATEVETRRAADVAVATFSGGLDSCFTLQKTCLQAHSDTGPDIRAVVMIHGFDIPLGERGAFEKAFHNAGVVCRSARVDLIPLRTNFRPLFAGRWEDRHGTGLAASLLALQSGYGTGVISATIPRRVSSTWGSNSTTDPMLGSRGMEIVHYGSEATRLEKFKSVVQWPEALANLRVCWQSWDLGDNCGLCQKCLLTQLSLRCLNAELSCFAREPDDHELASRIPDLYPGYMDCFDLRELLVESRVRGIDTPWSARLEELYGGEIQQAPIS